MSKLVALLAVGLTACASTTGVTPIGPDVYSISRRDYGPMASLGALKAAAYRDAAAYCARSDKALNVIQGFDVPRSFGQLPETEVQFSCVPK